MSLLKGNVEEVASPVIGQTTNTYSIEKLEAL
jgi:hypothetical protein